MATEQSKTGRILTAAEDLFKRYGFQKSTIQDICKIAGLSKPTFYVHFRDKSDVFAQLILHISERLIVDWQSNLPDGLTPKENLTAFVDLYTEKIITNTLFHAVFEDPEVMHRFSEAIMQQKDSPIFKELKQIIDDGIASMQFRPHDSETSVWLIYSMLDSLFLMMPLLLRKPVESPDPAMINEVKNFILKGVGSVE